MSSTVKRFASVFVMGLSVGLIGSADAQTAFRCDGNGRTVYSDAPCPEGKAVATTQDSAAQRAAAKDANAQMRGDNADLNKRLSDREKLAAQERAAARKAAGKPATVAAKTGGKGKATQAKAVKKLKTAKKARDSKKSKNDAILSAAK